MEVYGTWSVKFDIYLDGERVRFDDLSEVSQEHIAEMIKNGFLCGELCEWREETNTSEE